MIYSFLTRHLFDDLPQSVKKFPWARTMENLLTIAFNLAVAMFKYLSPPILALMQLSEMSYCAHERKLLLAPTPFLAGLTVLGAMKDTAIELSEDLKEEGSP